MQWRFEMTEYICVFLVPILANISCNSRVAVIYKFFYTAFAPEAVAADTIL